MTANVLVNSQMEIDDLHEGAPVMCKNGPGLSTEGPTRWFAQLDAQDCEVAMERIIGPAAPGSFSFCRLTTVRPAREITGLDRLQLFQPIEADELFGLTTGDGAGLGGAAVEGGYPELPLEMRFDIRTNVDFEVGCTLNTGAADRNFTVNRAVRAGGWQTIRVAIPRDPQAPWLSQARFGMYFQIGLSCGDTRLAPEGGASSAGGAWNDGHWLMIVNPSSAKFLTTEDAQAEITRCYFGPALAAPLVREATMTARTRTQRFIEKSYFTGTGLGGVNEPNGAFEIIADAQSARGRVHFAALKLRHYIAHLYSQSTGLEGCAYDVTGAKDVVANVFEKSPQGMTVAISDSEPGHVYRFHWMVHDLE